MLMAALQFALLIGYLFYPSYLNHTEAIVAAVSWLGWEGYPSTLDSIRATFMASHTDRPFSR